MRARTAAFTDSTWERGGGLSRATELYIRDEYGEDGWVPSSGEVSLYC